jgi:hypothetical protein
VLIELVLRYKSASIALIRSIIVWFAQFHSSQFIKMAVTFKMSLIVAVFTFICLSTNAYPSNSGEEVESTTEANDTVPQDL